jgi:hypothetical protein
MRPAALEIEAHWTAPLLIDSAWYSGDVQDVRDLTSAAFLLLGLRKIL